MHMLTSDCENSPTPLMFARVEAEVSAFCENEVHCCHLSSRESSLCLEIPIKVLSRAPASAWSGSGRPDPKMRPTFRIFRLRSLEVAGSFDSRGVRRDFVGG